MSAVSISPETIRFIDEIRNDRTHGASELARQAAGVIKYTAGQCRAGSARRFLLEVEKVGQKLMSARPAMAPVYNIVRLLLGAISEEAVKREPDSLRQFAIYKADELIEGSLLAVDRIAGHASGLVGDGEVVMTHSYSSTVIAALKEAFTRRNIRVITTRSGPGRAGERTAEQLSLYGAPVTFVDDTSIGLYISKADKVMVGADRVCADGMVVNGVGTYLLALATKAAGIPFYVPCETLKFDPRLRGEEVDLEEKDPSEVVEPGRLPPMVMVSNLYFDITPPELISGIVTEDGLLRVEEAIKYMRRAAIAYN